MQKYYSRRLAPGQAPDLPRHPREPQVSHPAESDAHLGNLSIRTAPEAHQPAVLRAERVGVEGCELLGAVRASAEEELPVLHDHAIGGLRFIARVLPGVPGELLRRRRALRDR